MNVTKMRHQVARTGRAERRRLLIGRLARTTDPLIPESSEVGLQPYLDVLRGAVQDMAELTATPVLLIDPLHREDDLERIWLEGDSGQEWRP